MAAAPQTELSRLRQRVAALEALVKAAPYATPGTEIVDGIADPFIALDDTLRITYANAAAESLLGGRLETLAGQPLSAQPPVLSVPDFVRACQQAGQDRSAVRLDAEHNGRAYEVRVYPRERGLSIQFQDVTDRKGVEDALRHRDEELTRITDNVPAIVSFLDRNGRFIRVNRRYEEVFGRPASWVVGKDLSEVAGEPHASLAKPYMDRALAGEAVSFESQILHKDGGLRDISLTYTPQFGADGAVIGLIAMVQDITQRKRAERALRDSEERLRLAVSAARLGIWSRAIDDDRVECSEQCRKNIGANPGEPVSHAGLLARIHEEDRPRLQQAVADAIATHGTFECEYRISRPDGSQHWVLAHGRAVYDDDGKPIRTVGVSRDITDRKRHEEALRETQERFRVLTQAMPQLVWTSTPDGETDFANERWSEYTGQSREQSLGRGWMLAIHPDDIADLVKSWESSTRSEAGYETTCRIRRASDGAYRWHLLRAFPAYDAAGTLFKWIGTCTDIHDQRAAQDAIRDYAERLNIAMATARLGDWSWDFAAWETTLSETAAGIFGLEAGRYASDQITSLIHPDDFAEVEARGRSAIEEGVDYQVEHRVRHSSGAWRWVSVKGRVMRDPAGAVRGFLGVMQDITDRRAAEAAERRMTESLRLANADLEQFAYSASHDLREPLRTVTAFTQLLERRYGDVLDDTGREFVGYTVSAAKRMESLVQDLLAYTGTTKTAADSESADGNAIVRDVIESLQPEVSAAAANIVCDPIPNLAMHGVHLHQLLSNVIGNALKYRGESPAEIRIRASQDGPWARISVEDNGIGFDPRYGRQIFGLFKRLHAQDQYPGTGIGLAICQKIVDRYGGRIWAESQGEGRGAAFVCLLPLAGGS